MAAKARLLRGRMRGQVTGVLKGLTGRLEVSPLQGCRRLYLCVSLRALCERHFVDLHNPFWDCVVYCKGSLNNHICCNSHVAIQQHSKIK